MANMSQGPVQQHPIQHLGRREDNLIKCQVWSKEYVTAESELHSGLRTVVYDEVMSMGR